MPHGRSVINCSSCSYIPSSLCSIYQHSYGSEAFNPRLQHFCYLYYRFKTLASQSKDELVSLGFPSFTIEDFHQVVSSILIAFPYFIVYQYSRRDGCDVISTFKADWVTFFIGTHYDVFFDKILYPQGVSKTQNGTMVSLNSFLDRLNSAQVSLNIIDWTLVSSQ